MYVQSGKMAESLVSTGSLVTCLDYAAIGREQPKLEGDRGYSGVSWEVWLPSTVCGRLVKGAVRRPNKQLHLGLLAIACYLTTPRIPCQYQLAGYMHDNGFSHDALVRAMKYASARPYRMRVAMRSMPYIGRAYKKQNETPK